MQNITAFIITSVIIIVMPGTGVIYTISTGITKGKKASILAVIGCVAGIIPHLCASVMLSSLLLEMNYKAFFILKLIGSVYLLYLGIRMLISKTKLELENIQSKEKPVTIIRQGILINLLNPKLTLFFFSFLPQYVSIDSRNYVFESILFGLAFMLLSFVIFVVYGVSAGYAKSLLIHSSQRMKRLQQVFGIVFILFAVQLAVSTF